MRVALFVSAWIEIKSNDDNLNDIAQVALFVSAWIEILFLLTSIYYHI